MNPEVATLCSDILKELLDSNRGTVSTQKLRKVLHEHESRLAEHASSVEQAVTFLKDQAHDDAAGWVHWGKSFYTRAAYEAASAEQAPTGQTVLQSVPSQPAATEVRSESHENTRNSSRVQEESRLCTNYILPFLSELYDSEHVPDGVEYAFDVHDERPSTDFRNVDLIAVDWRAPDRAELVAVEAKLHFNTQLIQQAANYTRFAHRVWAAVAVDSQFSLERAAVLLRAENRLLFDYALHLGLGIAVCRRTTGRSYQVFPIQWPRLQDPNDFEKSEFLESYRKSFEEAGILQPKKTFRVAV